MISVESVITLPPRECTSERKTHSGNAILRVDIGSEMSAWLCEECGHCLLSAFGGMMAMITELSVAQLVGLKKRPAAYKMNAGAWNEPT